MAAEQLQPDSAKDQETGVQVFAFDDEPEQSFEATLQSQQPGKFIPKFRKDRPMRAYEANKRRLQEAPPSGLAGEKTLGRRGYTVSPQGGEELPPPSKH